MKVVKLHSPDSKVHGANMGPTWVLAAPDGPHVGPMNLAIRVFISWSKDSSLVSLIVTCSYVHYAVTCEHFTRI